MAHIEVRFIFSSVDDAKAFVGSIGKKGKEILSGDNASGPSLEALSSEPVNLGGGAAEQALAAAAPAPVPTPAAPGNAATETAGSDIASMLGGGQAPAAVAPPTPAAAAPAPVAPAAPTPPEAPPAPAAEAVTLDTLIGAFTRLGQTKGRDAIAQVLAEQNVTQVIQIPEANFPAVLQRVNQLLSS